SGLVLARVLCKQRHLWGQGEVCVETVVIGDILQNSVQIVRTRCRRCTRQEIQSSRAVGVASLVVIVLSGSAERGEAESVREIVLDQPVTAVSYPMGLVKSPAAALIASESQAAAVA